MKIKDLGIIVGKVLVIGALTHGGYEIDKKYTPANSLPYATILGATISGVALSLLGRIAYCNTKKRKTE